jgi:hypothetical protein
MKVARTNHLFLLAVAVIAFTGSPAESRHRHHRDNFGFLPYSDALDSADLEQRERIRGPNLTDLVPRGWQLQPPDPKWKGKRFLSPDGSAWLATYSTPVTDQTVAAHMQAIAFVDGETPTYLRGEQDWIAVSGLKGDDRIFYRKAVIACDGKVWHHIAFEYPLLMKRELDRYVSRASKIIDQADNDGCNDVLSSEKLAQ